jgi:V8-like Glu-specific endopeptidase
MSSKPMKLEEVARVLKPRPPLTSTDLKVSFEAHVHPTRPGLRLFPAPVRGTILQRPERTAVLDEKSLTGYAPEHLAFNPVKPTLDPELRRPAFFDPRAEIPKGKYMATTIFPPDNRFTFSDTSFPWCTVGRVDLGGGWGSGCLVGPRHLLCASHMMTWNSDNTVNQVTFTPSYFDGNAPFGNSGIIHWYAYRKVVGPFLSGADVQQDYVVLVLSHRLGDVCGWMGTRGYSSDWNGLPDWSHIGYPGDISGGTRPTFQGSVAINRTDGGADDEEEEHKADVFPGQSGGPLFAWWSGEGWPRATGVQSAQNSATNLAGGGNEIPNLVNQARADFP